MARRAAADCTVTGNADGTYTATIYAYKGSEISFDLGCRSVVKSSREMRFLAMDYCGTEKSHHI